MKILKVIKHKDISEELLDEIIKLKSVAWPFSYESQKKWINENLKNSDIHVLLYADKTPLAYLNLIEIELEINSEIKESYGIGNVCAVEKGKGYGKDIILKVNSFLIENKRIGMLMCKKELLKFYKENGWIELSKKQTNVPRIIDLIHVLFFNVDLNANIKYFGKPF